MHQEVKWKCAMARGPQRIQDSLMPSEVGIASPGSLRIKVSTRGRLHQGLGRLLCHERTDGVGFC